MASRTRGGRSRRGGRGRARALGRPRPAPRRRRRRGRVPRAGGGADPGPGTARGACARRRAGEAEAGSREAAEALLATAELTPLDELQRARLQLLRAQIAFVFARGSDAPALLVETARRLEALDPALARETYLEALGAAMYSGRLDADSGVLEGGRGGPGRTAGRRGAAIHRLRTRRLGAPVHGRPRRGRAAAQARARRGHQRGARRSRGDHALADAVAGRPVDDGVRAVGRRRVPRARHPRGAAGSGYRRARPASRRTRLPLRRARVRRGARRGRGAHRRRPTRSRSRPATQPLMFAWLLLDAWRGVEAEAMEHINAGLGSGAGAREGCRRWPATPPPFSTTAWAATRRRWRAPGAAATTATGGTRARRCRSSSRRRPGAGSRRSLPPRGAAGGADAARRARIGRSASWPAHAHS